MSLPELGEGAAYEDGYLITWEAPEPGTKDQLTMQEALLHQDMLSKILRGDAPEAAKKLAESGKLGHVEAKLSGYPPDRNMI